MPRRPATTPPASSEPRRPVAHLDRSTLRAAAVTPKESDMRVETARYLRWNEIPEEQVNETMARRLISGEREMVAQVRMKKGCVVPEHAHESEQITYVLEGALQFRIDGKEFVVGANEVVHIPSNVPHAAFALAETVELDIFSPIRQDWLDKT